LHLNLMQLNC